MLKSAMVPHTWKSPPKGCIKDKSLPSPLPKRNIAQVHTCTYHLAVVTSCVHKTPALALGAWLARSLRHWAFPYPCCSEPLAVLPGALSLQVLFSLGPS